MWIPNLWFQSQLKDHVSCFVQDFEFKNHQLLAWFKHVRNIESVSHHNQKEVYGGTFNSKQPSILTFRWGSIRDAGGGKSSLNALSPKPWCRTDNLVNKHFIIHQRCFLFLSWTFATRSILWGTNIDEADFAVADLMSLAVEVKWSLWPL